MFADDTNLSCAGKTSAEIEHKLNADPSSHVSDWFECYKNRIYANSLKRKTKTISHKSLYTYKRIHYEAS